MQIDKIYEKNATKKDKKHNKNTIMQTKYINKEENTVLNNKKHIKIILFWYIYNNNMNLFDKE